MVQEVPSLDAFQHVRGPQGVWMLGAASIPARSAMNSFVRRFATDFPRPATRSQHIEHTYGTFQIPENYLIDSTAKCARRSSAIRMEWTRSFGSA